MKDDSNKQKTINEQSELNLSFYFSFEESSSTESQNQKQLKAVPLYTVSGGEHSQDERPCALPKSIEFDYEEEPVERVLQCCFCDEISSDCDLCGGPHTDFVYPTGAEDCIDYCGVCGDVGCEFCSVGSDEYVPHELIQKLKNFGYDFSSYEESAIVNSVLFKNKENPLGLMQLWEDEGKYFMDAYGWITCGCEYCSGIRNNIINRHRESKISESDLSASPLIEEIEVVENEPLQAPETLLVRAKRQLKNSVKAAIKEPYLFSLNLVRFVIIPLIVATMVALFGKYGIGESQDKFVSGTYTFFFFITVLAGFVLNLEFYKKIKLYQNDEPLNYVDVRYRQGTYLIAHLYTLIVMVVASEIHLMPSAFLLSLIVGSAIALFAFYDESDNKF